MSDVLESERIANLSGRLDHLFILGASRASDQGLEVNLSWIPYRYTAVLQDVAGVRLAPHWGRSWDRWLRSLWTILVDLGVLKVRQWAFLVLVFHSYMNMAGV